MPQISSPDIARLRDAELVDYSAVAALKIAALRAAYRSFAANGSDERRQDFALLSAGARPGAGKFRGIRDPAGATFRRVVGMA